MAQRAASSYTPTLTRLRLHACIQVIEEALALRAAFAETLLPLCLESNALLLHDSRGARFTSFTGKKVQTLRLWLL